MPQFRLQDILDILILSILIFQLYSWFRKTRAMRVLAGLGTISIIYFVAKLVGLPMTGWVLQQLGTVVIIVIVVVFQSEIRQTLYRFSRIGGLMHTTSKRICAGPSVIADTVFGLAKERCGAIIVFQRLDNLEEYLSNGTQLDALISSPLLNSIFQVGTLLHDGAVLVRDGRVVQAACLLPLSNTQSLPQQYGTRHRAAVGLTEQTDAVVLVVSEERGEVSLAEAGDLKIMQTPEQLQERLEFLLKPEENAPRGFIAGLFSDLMPKAAITLLVAIVWLLLSARQGEVQLVPVNLSFHGLPAGMSLVKVSPEEVTVGVKSNFGLLPIPQKLNLSAELDLSTVKNGQNILRTSADQIKVPAGMTVVGIEPASIRVQVRANRQQK